MHNDNVFHNHYISLRTLMMMMMMMNTIVAYANAFVSYEYINIDEFLKLYKTRN